MLLHVLCSSNYATGSCNGKLWYRCSDVSLLMCALTGHGAVCRPYAAGRHGWPQVPVRDDGYSWIRAGMNTHMTSALVTHHDFECTDAWRLHRRPTSCNDSVAHSAASECFARQRVSYITAAGISTKCLASVNVCTYSSAAVQKHEFCADYSVLRVYPLIHCNLMTRQRNACYLLI